MTRVSGISTQDGRNFTGLSRLARTSLVGVGVMATMGSGGCFITESPEFKEPPVLPPFIANVNPPTSRILVIPRKPGTATGAREYVQDVEIRFDIRSEDLQRPLYAAVWVDFPKPNKYPICSFALSTGTLATARPQTCTLAIPSLIEAGCHSITALVSHDQSIYNGKVEGDLDTATWWAQIGVDDAVPCEPDPLPPDAGRDVRGEGGI
jgi:hypothetical protein